MQGVAEVGSTANKYEILAKLATGGMAEIFLARGAGVGGVERYVVLKRILRERANDAEFVQMFLEEARLAAQLNHPNVAQVFDIGKLGESYFFTMEYVHGETVRNLLHRARSLRREIPLGCILTVIAGAATGLHHAHDRIGVDGRPLGIVHRDVSPSNLMISYEGSVKVVDFGVAKADNRAQETRSGTVKGKISYLSPEQIGGGSLDRRSDMFALGIVLWEMLTTERLYRRASDFENMNAIVNESPEVPSKWRRNLPRELDEMSIRLLSKRPEQRYQSGEELVQAIEELAARVGAQLSSAALGRFMRELFGQRPEPWHEVEFRDAPPENVTVTNEPIPADLRALDPVEADLARVRDLSMQFAAVGSQSASLGTPVPPPSDFDSMQTIGVPHDDMMKTIQGQSPAHYAAIHGEVEIRPTTPMRGMSPPPPPGVRPPPMQGVSPPTLRMPGPPTGAPASSPPAMSARRGPVAIAMPAIPPAAPPAKSHLPIVIGVAALFGVIGTIIVLVATGSPDKPDAVATGSNAGSSAIVASDPAPVAGPSNPAGVAPAPTPTTAATVAKDPVVVATPPAPRTPAQVEKITSAYSAARYEEVVALCRESVGDKAHLCTVAACQRADASRARSWLARVPAAQRTAVLAECKDAGLDLPAIKVKPVARPEANPDLAKPEQGGKPARSKECIANPMKCQH